MNDEDLPSVEFPVDPAYQWRDFFPCAEISYEIQLEKDNKRYETLETVMVTSPYVLKAYANKVNGVMVGVYYRFNDARERLTSLVPKKCLNYQLTYHPGLAWEVGSEMEAFERDGQRFSLHPASATIDHSLTVGVAICRDGNRIEIHSKIGRAQERFAFIKEHGYMSTDEILEKYAPHLKEKKDAFDDGEIQLDTENFPWRNDKRPVIELPLELLWDVPKGREKTACIAGQQNTGLFSNQKKIVIMVLESPYLMWSERRKGFGVFLNGDLKRVFSHYLGAAGYMPELAKEHGITGAVGFNQDLLWEERELIHEDYCADQYFPNSISFRRHLHISVIHNQEDDLIAVGLFDEGNLVGVFMSADEAADEMSRLIRHCSLRYLGNSCCSDS